MIQKKICMLGAFAVGKTSLVARYVHSIFPDKYLTTMGVKIDRKEVLLGDVPVNLMLWDIHGEDQFQKVRASYLRGSAGYLLVVDGTRPETLETALQLHQLALTTIGEKPFLLLLNKCDLQDSWELDGARIAQLVDDGWAIRSTSAKTGAQVEEAFLELARRTVG